MNPTLLLSYLTSFIHDENFENEISFQNISFKYKKEFVLKDFSLTIKKGQTVAIVGATGAGKSTIINLINRFYELDSGVISVDAIPVEDYELSSLRNQIAIVLQDVFLFSDTVLNNITLNDKSITREDVIAASKAVGAHDFIMKLPNGYDYEVGERGGVLSVGQRQLLFNIFEAKGVIVDDFIIFYHSNG